MPQNQDETRSIEYRVDTDSPGFDGYAVRFLTLDTKGSSFSRGSFRKTVRERGDRIPLLFNHNPNQLIGKVTELRTDQIGLRFRANVVESTSLGKDVMELVRAGALGGMSFAFRSMKERPGRDDDGIDLSAHPGVKPGDIRFIEEVRLSELSAATFPSGVGANITSYRSENVEERLEAIFDELRSIGVEDEKINSFIENFISLVQESRNDTPPEEPSSDTLVVPSRHKIDLEIELALLGV